jgi:two-component system phosphate regulon sensor histidine kinase PhoR
MSGSESVSGQDDALDTATPPNRFEWVLEQLPQAVVLVDPALMIQYANPAARSLLRAESPVGEPVPEPWPGFSLRRLAASLFTSTPPTVGSLVRTDDRVFWLEGVPAVETKDAVLIVEDITERDRARRTEREFVENAAHELRTPLAAIVSVMDVLEGGAKDVPEARDRFLKHIRVQSERLSRMARSLLVLARLQTGVEQPRLTAVPVRPLLEEVRERLDPYQGVDVTIRSREDVGVLGDTDLLHQIVANIAENAAKHTRAGEIVLEARNVGNTTEIEIRDTGPGMSGDEKDRAFQRFYRAADDSTDGFGLGLAIAREAVRALSGTIELDSEPGAGTRVRVALPNAKILS